MRYMLSLCLLLASLTAGCNTSVPVGHVGLIKSVSGFNGEPLAPGLHTAWGRDTMHLMQVTDKQFDIPMSVLCKDQLNFKFNIGVLAAVDKTKKELIKYSFENILPANGSTITIDELFAMYVQPVVDQEARKVISRYDTGEIATKREEVIKSVRAAVSLALSESVLTVKRITINNMDFPDAITQAQEARAKRQIAVETMKAETEMQMEKARGQLRVAQIEYQKELVEAAMIADSNKIIGASITKEFLAWHEIKVLGKAAMGPNNWGFIPYTSNAQSTLGGKFEPKKLIVDQELLKRIEAAKAGGQQPAEAPKPAKPTEVKKQ